jgi:hypothetical protein
VFIGRTYRPLRPARPRQRAVALGGQHRVEDDPADRSETASHCQQEHGSDRSGRYKVDQPEKRGTDDGRYGEDETMVQPADTADRPLRDGRQPLCGYDRDDAERGAVRVLQHRPLARAVIALRVNEFLAVELDRAHRARARVAAGLFAISLGLSAVFDDDHEMLRHGMVMYDALFAWCKSLQIETHNWPPQN